MAKVTSRSVLLLVLVLSGCGGGAVAPTTAAPPQTTATASPTDPPSPSPAASTAPASPTAGVTASPSASGAATGVLDLCPEEREPCPLQPGTYSPSRTTPKVTFTLGEGWTGFRHYEDAFGLGHQEGAAFSMARDVELGYGGVAIEPGPAALQAFLAATQVLQAQAAAPVTVGGIDGVQIDVVATADAGGLYAVEQDQYNLGQGQKARFILLDVEGTTVLFVFESADEASFPAAEAVVQPILDSITFE